ncbi:MAG TPA: lysylphosphatidylglycerol synthase transmembrane domain-containing protein [Gemmatimonadales bacterium]|nr:lysylphosphatidylglycerol synthase transmembrane domain-containing protein [Gemmatimonadales bacterium]
MTPLTAHAICLALVTADLLARAWRIQWLLHGLGYRISFREAFGVNAIGEAACALSPLRIAGEPARLGTMLRAGVPATAAFVAITYEVLAAWPVIIVVAAVLGWNYLPEWWAFAGPAMHRAIVTGWPIALFITVLTLGAWAWTRRNLPAATRPFKRPIKRMRVHWRRMPMWPILASLPLTFTNVLARALILPVLASTLPHPPPFGPVLVGSIALLYSQLILPTPSGAGAVDLGFVAGAAGDLGTDQGKMLLAWRFYTTIIGVVLGLVFAVRIFGIGVIRRMFKPGSMES